MNQGLLAPDIVSVAFWGVLSRRWLRFLPESKPRVSLPADRLGCPFISITITFGQSDLEFVIDVFRVWWVRKCSLNPSLQPFFKSGQRVLLSALAGLSKPVAVTINPSGVCEEFEWFTWIFPNGVRPPGIFDWVRVNLGEATARVYSRSYSLEAATTAVVFRRITDNAIFTEPPDLSDTST